MSYIEKLIDDALCAGNFCNEKDAETFLIQYPQDDQCALITAARIGKDHFTDQKLREGPENSAAYFTPQNPFNRFHTTGTPSKDVIPLETLAKWFFLLSNDLPGYYDAFMRCAKNSGYDLANF